MTENPADSPEGWLRHYLTIDARDLAAEYLSRTLREDREVSPVIEAAIQERREEVEVAVSREEPESEAITNFAGIDQ